MKHLRIAMLHWGFPPIIGGVETHLTLLCPALVRLGHSVSLLTGAAEGQLAEQTIEGVKVTRTPLMDLNWLAKRGFEALELELHEEVDRFLEAAKPDLMHAHNMHYFSPLHARELQTQAKRRGIPLILTAHNVWDDGEFLELTRKIAWSHIIAVSAFIQQELLAVGVSERQVTMIHHGIDVEHLASARVDQRIVDAKFKGRRIIFHPARMGLAKGNDVSVKAMRLIKQQVPEAMLVMAGTKNIIDWTLSQEREIGYILHLVREFKLTDDVYVNYFTRKEIISMYAIAEVCIYPSAFGEPFGLTMLESLAAGKPMVVTDSGGMPEIIKSDVNGYVIRVRDVQALAERCVRLLRDDALRQRLGETGQRMVRARFTVERMVEDHLAVYHGCLQ